MSDPDSKDGLESKSSKRKRPAMLLNMSKISEPPPPGDSGSFTAIITGAVDMEHKPGEFEPPATSKLEEKGIRGVSYCKRKARSCSSTR